LSVCLYNNKGFKTKLFIKNDAKRCKSKEVESIYIPIKPFSINENIDRAGFNWTGYP